MNPIFNEYIEFLHHKSVNLDLKEGYYWLDRQIIKCFDKKCNIHKIARLKTENDLSMTYTIYKEKPFEIASWNDLIELNKKELLYLEQKAKKLILDSIEKYKEYEPICLTSGGKDSIVTMNLLREVIPESLAIFNNTSLDCADTYKYIKKQSNIMTTNPKEGFYQWQKRLQFVPTRFARACCTKFKEGELVNQYSHDKKCLFFMGMRNEESAGRSEYGDEWKNSIWSDNWQGILPVREWTEVGIWLYILMKNIDINAKYKKGYSRVGCNVACPYYTKSTWVLDEYWYPKAYARWQNIVKRDFIDNNKWLIMNCTLDEYTYSWTGGTVRDEPTEEVIKEFAKYNNLDFNVAEKFFSKKCKVCDKKIKSKQVIGMNMKFLGRNIEDLMCKKHLKEFLSIDNEKWDEYIKGFKKDGCDLF